MRDYQDGSVYVMGLGKMDKTPISGSNVLYFELDDGCSFIVRPSGTEPLIRVMVEAGTEQQAQAVTQALVQHVENLQKSSEK